MTRQIILLVEGQTEEALVNQVLAPAVAGDGVYLTPVPVQTSATGRGGGSWNHYDATLCRLLSQVHWWRVGLLIDYYQYPKRAPGSDSQGSAAERQQAMVEQLRATFPDPRFRPLVVMHEIEALVLAAIAAGQGEAIFPPNEVRRLKHVIERAGGPEQVNDGPSTSPSKRLLAAHPRYSKVVTGPRLVEEAGLDAVLERCPVFAAWWRELLDDRPE